MEELRICSADSHVNDKIDLFEATPYRQANRIFANLGNGKFRARASRQRIC